MATVLDVLKGGLRLIQTVGWCQRWYSYAADSEGHRQRCAPECEQAECFCLAGCLYRAAHDLGCRDYLPLISAARLRLRSVLYNLDCKLEAPVWNDCPGRTKEQVEALLKVAIHDEELGAPTISVEVPGA